MHAVDLKRGISIGAYGGMVWGLVVLGVSAYLKFFAFDFTILHDIPIFMAGGAGMGLIVGAFMEVLGERLPFEGAVAKGIVLSVAIWLVFFIPGVFLHLIKPDRYTVEIPLHIQGLFLAMVLGMIIGGLWKKGRD